MPAVGARQVGIIGLVPTGVTEDRWVKSVEVREVNNIPRRRRHEDGRRPFRLPSHDVSERRCAGQREGQPRAGRFTKSAATLTVSRGGWPAARGEFVARPERRTHSRERSRHEGASRVRLQVLPEGLSADVQAVADLARQRQRSRREAERIRSAGARVRDADRAHEDHRVRAAPARAGHPDVSRSDLGHERSAVDLRRLRPQLGQAVHLRRRRGAAAAEGHDPASHRLPRHDAGEQEPRGPAQLGRRRSPLDREHVHRPRLLGRR